MPNLSQGFCWYIGSNRLGQHCRIFNRHRCPLSQIRCHGVGSVPNQHGSPVPPYRSLHIFYIVMKQNNVARGIQNPRYWIAKCLKMSSYACHRCLPRHSRRSCQHEEYVNPIAREWCRTDTRRATPCFEGLSYAWIGKNGTPASITAIAKRLGA